MDKKVKWVEVRNSKDQIWRKRILVDVLRNDRCICVSGSTTEKEYKKGFGYNVVTWNMWREIKETTYKAYTKLTDEVMQKLKGQWVRSKDGKNYCTIIGFTIPTELIELSDFDVFLNELFEDWIFDDGAPIGEVVE